MIMLDIATYCKGNTFFMIIITENKFKKESYRDGRKRTGRKQGQILVCAYYATLYSGCILECGKNLHHTV